MHGGSHKHDHDHSHGADGHTHGLVDQSILRSKEGIQAVSLSLVVLLLTAVVQAYILSLTYSISLLADVIHNFGDALTAVPLAAAFLLRNRIAEKYAGYFVVLTIFVSAGITAFEALRRLAHPQTIDHLYILVAAGIIGFLGNEIAAVIRIKAGKHLHSPALIADGNHARVDGFVSISVIVSAIFAALGFHIADPIIGLLVTFLILHITWQSYKTISNAR